MFAAQLLRQAGIKTTEKGRDRVAYAVSVAMNRGDAARIASSDLNRWKTKLIDAGRHPKTMRDAKLAPVRTILQWGVDKGRLPTNAAARITIDLKTKALERKRSFNDKEAKMVLITARKEDNPVLRWVP